MSVRKRTWKTNRGEPRSAWLVDYFDQTGKRHARSFTKKKDADAFHDSVRTDIRSGRHVPLGAETVAALCDRWIKHIEAEGRERTTVAQYEQHVRLHIAPRLGGVKLNKLTSAHMERFRDDLLASVSRQLARKVLVSLSSALRVARLAHLMEGVSIGTDARNTLPIEAGRDFPTGDEVRRMIAAATEPKARALLLVLALTGVRSSELRGLRWADVDLRAGELHVRQRADCYLKIGPTKSAAGVRKIPLEPELLIPALRAWKIQNCGHGKFNARRASWSFRIRTAALTAVGT